MGNPQDVSPAQVKLNVQRTLAIELQRLSVQFRKQQKAYLNRLRQKNGPSASGASFSVLDETAGTSGREALDPEYDPGFNEIQVCEIQHGRRCTLWAKAWLEVDRDRGVLGSACNFWTHSSQCCW